MKNKYFMILICVIMVSFCGCNSRIDRELDKEMVAFDQATTKEMVQNTYGVPTRTVQNCDIYLENNDKVLCVWYNEQGFVQIVAECLGSLTDNPQWSMLFVSDNWIFADEIPQNFKFDGNMERTDIIYQFGFHYKDIRYTTNEFLTMQYELSNGTLYCCFSHNSNTLVAVYFETDEIIEKLF